MQLEFELNTAGRTAALNIKIAVYSGCLATSSSKQTGYSTSCTLVPVHYFLYTTSCTLLPVLYFL